MNRLVLVALTSAALVLPACNNKPAPEPTPPAAPPTPPVPAPLGVPGAAADWKTLDTKDFSVSLPGEAKMQEGTEQTEAGPVKTTTWGLQTTGAFFAVSIADYPAGMMAKAVPSKVLEGARDGAMANVGGTVEKDIGVFLDSGLPKKKYPGREFNGSTKSGLKLAARLFLVDDRLYQMICVSPKAGFNDADFKQFADSFKLKLAAAPAAPGSRTKK